MKRSLALLSFLLLSFSIQGQDQHVIDSLTARLQENLHDTDRVKVLNKLAWKFMYSNSDTSVVLSTEALAIAQAAEWEKGIAKSNSSLGSFNMMKGYYPISLEYYFTALDIFEDLNNKPGFAGILGNIGAAYWSQGDHSKALEYYFKSLRMDEELDKKTGIAISLSNIGLVYMDQGDYPKALKYFFKALEMDEELSDKYGISNSLGNIGLIYKEQHDNPKALEYYSKALKIDKELNNLNGIARHLGNIGSVYLEQGDFPKAMVAHREALKLDEKLNNKNGVARHLGNIGSVYAEIGEFDNADINYQKSLVLAKEMHSKEQLKFLYISLSNLYDTLEKPSRAFDAYKLHILYRDSINNEANTKAQTRTEMKYEFEKAQLVKEQKEKEAARRVAEETSRRDNLQYSVILLGLLVLGTLIVGLGKLALPPRVAEGIIFFSFLILFEFLLVLADPYIDRWSGGAPGIKLLFNASIAAFIFPAHAFFESRLKKRLVKK